MIIEFSITRDDELGLYKLTVRKNREVLDDYTSESESLDYVRKRLMEIANKASGAGRFIVVKDSKWTRGLGG